MPCNSCPSEPAAGFNDPSWRRALWIALAVNAVMFLGEMSAGVAAGSRSLLADALDFFGDAANYAISLGVAGFALAWRARAALVKGWTLVLLGLWVLGACLWAIAGSANPEPIAMGVVGTLALIANLSVALMLFRFRDGDANRRSVWICSRNDAIGNLAVLAAAAGVFGTGTWWPDIIVASIMAMLGISGGWRIISIAGQELARTRAAGAGLSA